MDYFYIIDSHIHTNNSDGKNSMLQMVQGAIDKGLEVITITDHCEIPRYFKGFDAKIRKSYKDFLEVKDEYGHKIKLLFGVEIGQPLDNLAASEDLLAAIPFDFVLATAHNIKGWKNTLYLSEYDPEYVKQLLFAYFDEIYRIIQWGRFDVLAHLTYPIRYMTKEQKESVDMGLFEDKINNILRLLIETGKGIEINMAGLFHQAAEPSPNAQIIKKYRQMGGEIITFASDAHRVEKISQGFNEGMDILVKAGFSRFCYFENRNAVFIPIIKK